GIHGRHVLRERSRHDGAGAVRVRSRDEVQPGKGVPDAAALRRPSRAVPCARHRSLRAGVARVIAARPADPEDSVAGGVPRIVYEPSTVEEAAEVVSQSAAGGKTLAFVGGGTDLELGAPPRKLDAILRTRGLNRIVDHAPSDQIVVVESGRSL